MPYKSKAQMRKFFAMESRSQLPKGTARTWAHHTENLKALPDRVSTKEAAGLQKLAFRTLASVALSAPQASVCRALATALGSGKTLKQAFDQCRVPDPVRVKVAREVLRRVRKQAVLGSLATAAVAAPAVMGAVRGAAQAPRGAFAEGAMRGATETTGETFGLLGGAGLGGYLANRGATSMGAEGKLRAALTAAGLLGGGMAGHFAGSLGAKSILESKPTWERSSPHLSEEQDEKAKAKRKNQEG